MLHDSHPLKFHRIRHKSPESLLKIISDIAHIKNNSVYLRKITVEKKAEYHSYNRLFATKQSNQFSIAPKALQFPKHFSPGNEIIKETKGIRRIITTINEIPK